MTKLNMTRNAKYYALLCTVFVMIRLIKDLLYFEVIANSEMRGVDCTCFIFKSLLHSNYSL